MKDRTQLLQRAYYPPDSVVSVPFSQSQAQSSSSRLSQDIHAPFENSRRERDFESAERFSRAEMDDMDGYTATRGFPYVMADDQDMYRPPAHSALGEARDRTLRLGPSFNDRLDDAWG